MSKKFLGRKDAIEQGREYSGGPGMPTKTVRSWKGEKSAVLAKLGEVQTAGFVFRLVEEGPVATLTAESPNLPGEDQGSQVVADQWELLPGEAEKDLLDADLALVNDLTKVEKEAIRKNLQDPPEESSTTNLVGNALSAYRLMLMGQRSRITFAPVLRRTVTVSNLYAVTWSVSNVGRVLKSSTIVANEGLPAGFLIAIANPPFAYTAVTKDGLAMSYGFLKKYPTLNQTVGGRLQIVQEWAFGLWPVASYLAAI